MNKKMSFAQLIVVSTILIFSIFGFVGCPGPEVPPDTTTTTEPPATFDDPVITELKSRMNSNGDLTVDISWSFSTASNASKFGVSYFESGVSGSDPTVDIVNRGISSSLTRSHSVNNAWKYNTKYSFQVIAYDSDDNEIGDSGTVVEVLMHPGKVDPLTAFGPTKNSIDLSWDVEGVDTGLSYDIYANFMSNSFLSAEKVGTVTTKTFTASDLTDDNDYYFWVVATNQSLALPAGDTQQGVTSTFATAKTLVDNGPKNFVADASVDVNGVISIGLSWSKSSSASDIDKFQVLVYETDSFDVSTDEIDVPVVALTNNYSMSIADIVGTPIGFNKNYYFKVISLDDTGVSLGDLTADALTYAEKVNVDTVNDASSDKLKVSWTAVDASKDVTYNVYMSNDGTLWNDDPVNADPLTTTSYVVDGLHSMTTYYFKVSSVNADGKENKAGNGLTGTTLIGLVGQIDVSTDATGVELITKDTMTITWEKQGDATYDVYITDIVADVTNGLVTPISNGTNNWYDAVSLDANTQYWIYVVANFDGSTSDPTVPTTGWTPIVTLPDVMTGPLDLSTDASGDVITANSVGLSWAIVTSSGDASSYRITATSTDTTPDVKSLNITDITIETAVIAGLNSNTIYNFSIAAVNSQGRAGEAISLASPVTTLLGLWSYGFVVNEDDGEIVFTITAPATGNADVTYTVYIVDPDYTGDKEGLDLANDAKIRGTLVVVPSVTDDLTITVEIAAGEFDDTADIDEDSKFIIVAVNDSGEDRSNFIEGIIQ